VVRDQANSVVHDIGALYPPETLFPLFVRVLDQAVPRLRLALLEFTINKLRDWEEYTANGAQVKSFMQKLIPLVADKLPELRRAANSAVVYLFRCQREAFITQLPLLPIGSQV